MVDLAQATGRQNTQNRLTNNRDAVLPNRRIVDAPDPVVRADMRNAFRGDDADEVRRALGLVNQAVDGIVDLHKAEAAEKAKSDSASGGLDAAAGKAYDPAKAKSRAYQDAYYQVSSEQKQGAWETSVETQITAMVNQGAHMEDIHKFFTDAVSQHANEAKDIYPSDAAKLHVAESTMKFTGQLEAKLTAAIKARTDKELVDGRAATVVDNLNKGLPVDFEGGVKPLLDAGINPEVAKDTIRKAITAVALDPEHPRPELLADLLDSKQADGKTPSLSADEQLQVENAYLQADGLLKKKAKEEKDAKQDALTLQWYDAAQSGKVVDDEIDDAVQAGTFTAQEGISLRGAFGRLRNDELEGEANDDLVIKLEMQLAKTHPNYASVRAQAAAAYKDGRLGTGRAAAKAYLGLLRSTAHDSSSATAAARGGSSKDDVADGKWLLGKLLTIPDDGEGVPPDSARAFILAKQAWRARVAKGESPVSAANAVATEWKPRVDGVAQAPGPTTGKSTKVRIWDPKTNSFR